MKENVAKAQARSQALLAVRTPEPRSMAASLLNLQRTRGNRFVQRMLHLGMIQAKLTVNQPGNRFEQEADRLADEAMRTADPGSLDVPADMGSRAKPSESSHLTRTVQRQVSEEEGQQASEDIEPSEEEILQIKAVALQEEAKKEPATKSVAQRARAGSGEGETRRETPIQVAERGFSGFAVEVPYRREMEARFGTDFSKVRAYTDQRAIDANRRLHAHAYTVGSQIAFRTPSPEKPRWLTS